MNLQQRVEGLPAPFHALIVWALSITGLLLTLLKAPISVWAVPLLYAAGFLQRHFSNPSAHPFLDPEKHGKSWFHPEGDTE